MRDIFTDRHYVKYLAYIRYKRHLLETLCKYLDGNSEVALSKTHFNSRPPNTNISTRHKQWTEAATGFWNDTIRKREKSCSHVFE